MGSCNFIVPKIVCILVLWFVKATAEALIMSFLSISHKPQDPSIESNPPSLKCWLMTYSTESTEFLILTSSVSMINISQYSYFYAIVLSIFIPFMEKYSISIYIQIVLPTITIEPLEGNRCSWSLLSRPSHKHQLTLICIFTHINIWILETQDMKRNEYSIHSIAWQALWPECIGEV